MISCSHWGLFPEPPRNANAANNFHNAMQIANLANQAAAINQMYNNIGGSHQNNLYQKLNFGRLD